MNNETIIRYNWPKTLESSITSAKLKSSPDDFLVNEILSFDPSNEGEHLFLLIEKRGANTNWVAQQLAKLVGCKERDIGYAGLKDRHAVTQQWFSLTKDSLIEPEAIDAIEGCRLIKQVRNNKKLRQGAIARNQFDIVLREVEGETDAIERHLSKIKLSGYPNYFGTQRFGHDMQNIKRAHDVLVDKRRVKRHQESIYFSALRSWCFNQVLGFRIEQGTWLQPGENDKINLSGSRSFFEYEQNDESIESRLESGDVHICGIMPGQDYAEYLTDELVSIYESLWEDYLPALKQLRVKSDFRPLRVIPDNLQWEWHSNSDLRLRFSLSSGSYATELLTELGNINDQSTGFKRA
ncbi:MAG: tRNA pseudouridine(13) synthase TruD [Gammaproteobacteria bacterium]|nr:tRNA pseudouridine(13) synthase TruD [Gammaproteobacteria bacterium]